MILGFPCVTLLKWILVTPIQFVIGARFYKGAYKSLRRGSANMDVLVAMGTTASYAYSVREGGGCGWSRKLRRPGAGRSGGYNYQAMVAWTPVW